MSGRDGRGLARLARCDSRRGRDDGCADANDVAMETLMCLQSRAAVAVDVCCLSEKGARTTLATAWDGSGSGASTGSAHRRTSDDEAGNGQENDGNVGKHDCDWICFVDGRNDG